MKKLVFVLIVLIGPASAPVDGEQLSLERQREIIENYMYVTGQLDRAYPVPYGQGEEHEYHAPVKCGMSAVADFVLNRDKLDRELLIATGVQLADRPANLNLSYDSPAGFFKLHYTLTGEDAVYQASVDNDGNGVPDYVDTIAVVLDSVYDYTITQLGYPPPPVDSFYPSGGDEKYDIYICNLGGGYYGLTYLDSLYIDGPGSIRATSFIELNNDYTRIFGYQDRPLDAARVTCAHEFFHAVQFGIDFTEAEPGSGGISRRYWMEMSAVWMEEEQYDEINDYYNYLAFFFVAPWASIQQFKSGADFHPYASVLYALYLSETYDRDVIRDIWFNCGSLGGGPDFLVAADRVIDSVSGGSESFASSFSEFALWNYFTGLRADLAPPGIGYSERADFPDTATFPDSVMAAHASYPVFVQGQDNPFNPDHNGALYMRFDELRTIGDDTSFWVCNSGSFPNCTDSSEVTDTTSGYDIMHIDSLFTVLLGLDPSFAHAWGFNVVYQLENDLDSIIVDQMSLPAGTVEGIGLGFINPHQYRSIALILTPASSNRAWYSPYSDYYVAYLVPEESSIDSALINLPAAMLAPYPNPAVVSNMDEEKIMFKFQVPTDSASYPIHGGPYSGSDPHLVVDIFTLAGEYIRTVDRIVDTDVREGEYWTEWDMKSAAGKKVASGVYIVYGRLYAKEKGALLAEERTKVAVIR